MENTGFVIQPYFFFPEILSLIRTLVQHEQSSSIKKLVFKLIGTMGALDPYLVKQITLYYNSPDGIDGSDIHSNIPLLRTIDLQLSDPNYLPVVGDMAADIMIQTSIAKNILKRRSKEDADAKQFNVNDPMNTGNNPAFRDMPMMVFYNQLGQRG